MNSSELYTEIGSAIGLILSGILAALTAQRHMPKLKLLNFLTKRQSSVKKNSNENANDVLTKELIDKIMCIKECPNKEMIESVAEIKVHLEHIRRQQDVHDEMIKKLIELSSEKSAKQATIDTGKTCLIVDDNEELAHQIKSIAEINNITCSVVCDVDSAIKTIEFNRYFGNEFKIAIIDYKLGRNKTGVDILKHLDKNNTEIIMITGYDDDIELPANVKLLKKGTIKHSDLFGHLQEVIA